MAGCFLRRGDTGHRCVLDPATCARVASVATHHPHFWVRIASAPLAQRYPQKWSHRHRDECSDFIRLLGPFYLDSGVSVVTDGPRGAGTWSDANGGRDDDLEHRQILWVRAFRSSWRLVGASQKLRWVSASGRNLGSYLWIYKEHHVVAYSRAVCRIFWKRLFFRIRSDRFRIISYGDSRDRHGH